MKPQYRPWFTKEDEFWGARPSPKIKQDFFYRNLLMSDFIWKAYTYYILLPMSELMRDVLVLQMPKLPSTQARLQACD